MAELKWLVNSWNYYYFWEAPAHATGVSLDKSSITLTEAGQTEQLTATVIPSDAMEKDVTWSSSDTSIATVSNTWLVTCITPWNCTITVTTVYWQHTATCSILEPIDYLCFTAEQANSSIYLYKYWSPSSVSLETSADWINWNTYSIWDIIILTNIWDKIYFRNTSETATSFNSSNGAYYHFSSNWWKLSASWDIWYLVNKNSTTTLFSNCFIRLFYNLTNLISSPSLTATTIWWNCYNEMFSGCTNLETIPALPATTLTEQCYTQMFDGCSKIKLSTTKTWEYQTPYRIPVTWTWSEWSSSLLAMFQSTWWTFTWTPTINTTYYTSNTVV